MEKDKNTDQQMVSNEDMSKGQIQLSIPPHQVQTGGEPDDIALKNGMSTIEGDEQANLDKEEAVLTNTSSSCHSNQSMKDAASINDLSNTHEASIQTGGEAEALLSKDLSQQLETEESKVEEALKRITSPPLPSRVDNVENCMPVPLKASFIPPSASKI